MSRNHVHWERLLNQKKTKRLLSNSIIVSKSNEFVPIIQLRELVQICHNLVLDSVTWPNVKCRTQVRLTTIFLKCRMEITINRSHSFIMIWKIWDSSLKWTFPLIVSQFEEWKSRIDLQHGLLFAHKKNWNNEPSIFRALKNPVVVNRMVFHIRILVQSKIRWNGYHHGITSTLWSCSSYLNLICTEP